jgi:hypothetical protein
MSPVPSNKATEEERERVPSDEAGDTQGEGVSPTSTAAESHAAPVHSTSAFKPDPFW